jgi:hypothetical protein
VFVLNDHEREMRKLRDEIAELGAHIAAATARWLRLLGRLDAADGWEEGYKTLAHWLSWRCGMSVATARDHVRVAQALRTRPSIQAAFERGELSYSKVRALVRLPGDVDEELMLYYARHASASQLETIVRGTRRCAAVEEGAERQLAERSFSWSWDDDGAVVFSGRLPAEQGALVIGALEAARDELGPPPKELAEGEDVFTREAAHSVPARNADALVALAQTQLSETAGAADAYQLVVHVDADSLRAGADPDSVDCRAGDGSPLPAELARRLACDASIVRVIERDGRPLSVGRKTRVISPALRRALRMRHGGCAFPGCTQRHHTDAHHVRHWADGGATDIDNCVPLCRFHHSQVHRGVFRVEADGDGRFRFLRANGKPIPQAPRQPRGDCAKVAGTARGDGREPAWLLYPKEATPRGALLGWSVEALLDSRVARRE